MIERVIQKRKKEDGEFLVRESVHGSYVQTHIFIPHQSVTPPRSQMLSQRTGCGQWRAELGEYLCPTLALPGGGHAYLRE